MAVSYISCQDAMSYQVENWFSMIPRFTVFCSNPRSALNGWMTLDKSLMLSVPICCPHRAPHPSPYVDINTTPILSPFYPSPRLPFPWFLELHFCKVSTFSLLCLFPRPGKKLHSSPLPNMDLLGYCCSGNEYRRSWYE